MALDARECKSIKTKMSTEFTWAEEFTLMYVASDPAVRTEMVQNATEMGISAGVVKQALIRLMNETNLLDRQKSSRETADPTDIWLENAETGELEIVVLTPEGKQAIRKVVANSN